MDVPRYLHLGYELWKGIELVDKLSNVNFDFIQSIKPIKSLLERNAAVHQFSA